MKETRKESCPCPRVGCPRHGRCEECAAFHAGNARHPLSHCRRHGKPQQKT